ARTAATARKS
nr:Chain E, ALA-ARG-THR-ALA-ALA-THR-ALA-ARG [Homo sapiens]6FKP_F Chain F, ALA-ARG-THR-ALA-ALA-THR-ALA-ARG [Homo sapiens]6FKP_G Chain G, ALA-ARG-THR-ALA-ALA-THR-ALA-ARG [Homo sapiens]